MLILSDKNNCTVRVPLLSVAAGHSSAVLWYYFKTIYKTMDINIFILMKMYFLVITT